MSEEFKAKLRALHFPRKMGSTEKAFVADEHGTITGYHLKHWDGRQDAQIVPETFGPRANINEEE